MKKCYQLPPDTDASLKGKDLFMKDKQKRYIKLDTASAGTMGYWDKKCVPMYTLQLQEEDGVLVCTLHRQEEKDGKIKHPRDWLISLIAGCGSFLLLLLILGVLVRMSLPVSLAISAIAGILILVVVATVYFFEYQGFYALLDTYLYKVLKAKRGKSGKK